MNTRSVNKTFLSDEIAKEITNRIVGKEFRPGDKLPSEFELSKVYNASRPTIREAIKILISSNIVEIKIGRGTYISKVPGLAEDPIGLRFIQDGHLLRSLLEARLLLEPGSARLAAQRAEKEDIDRLEECLSMMARLVEKSERDIDCEIEFHFTVAETTKNPVIRRIIPIVLESIYYLYIIPDQSISNVINDRKALAAHDKIFQAIKNHDGEKAEQEMINHLQETMRIVTESDKKAQ